MKGAVTAQSSSELDKIAEEIGNDYSEDDDDDSTATKTTTKYKNGKENTNKEMDGKNGTDYVMGMGAMAMGMGGLIAAAGGLGLGGLALKKKVHHKKPAYQPPPPPPPAVHIHKPATGAGHGESSIKSILCLLHCIKKKTRRGSVVHSRPSTD